MVKTHFFKVVRILPLFLVPGISAQASPVSDPLQTWQSGVANGYSAFLFGNYAYTYSETQSSVYVGGDATLSNFRVGLGPANLAVRGHLNFSSGYVTGDIFANNPSLNAVGQNPGSTVQPFGSNNAGLQNAQSFYQGLSSAWGGVTTLGGVSETSWGELSLNAHSGVNFFDLGGSSGYPVTPFNRFNINMQSDSTVVINLLGDNWNLHDLGFYLNNSQVDKYQDPNAWLATHIFFNFPDAHNITLGCMGQSLSCGGIGIPGNLLAPFATITAVNSQLIGGIVASSLTDAGLSTAYGRLEINNAPVPVPSSLLLLSSGLLWLARKRLHRQG